MAESTLAYLMGPIAMVVVGVALWAVGHYSRHDARGGSARWLDTHYVDLMHHKH
jgi:hypothetical protein